MDDFYKQAASLQSHNSVFTANPKPKKLFYQLNIELHQIHKLMNAFFNFSMS